MRGRDDDRSSWEEERMRERQDMRKREFEEKRMEGRDEERMGGQWGRRRGRTTACLLACCQNSVCLYLSPEMTSAAWVALAW